MIHFLCVTSRPQWRPFLELQWRKLDKNGNKLTVMENALTIGEARQQLLDASDPDASHIAFIDDDDWQSPLRAYPASDVDLMGSRVGFKMSPATRRAHPYTTTELCIFNGAVVRRDVALRCRFPPVNRCEDTAWMAAIYNVMTRGCLVVPQHLSGWMCHTQNISNKSSLLTFESPGPSYVSREEWEVAAACAQNFS